MSHDNEEAFSKLVDLLNGSPKEQCVIREEFLEDLGIDHKELGDATSRPVRRVAEIQALPEKNTALRDYVYCFAQKQEQA